MIDYNYISDLLGGDLTRLCRDHVEKSISNQLVDQLDFVLGGVIGEIKIIYQIPHLDRKINEHLKIAKK